VVDGALHIIQDLDPSKKWYFHIHFLDPHDPYDPPEAYQGDLSKKDLGEYDPRNGGLDRIQKDWPHFSEDQKKEALSNINILYRGQIEYLDTELQRLWDHLSEAGYLDHTLVLLVSDHGEQHFEHGGLEHLQSLHAEEGMGVAAFWSSTLSPLAWDGPVNHLDLSPTILETFQVEIPDFIEGSVVGTAPSDRLRFSSGMNVKRPVQSVDRLGIRLLFDWDKRPELYDSNHDPGETQDLFVAAPEEAACMFEFLRPMVEKVDEERAGGPPRLSAYR
jgi:arylsulfatase A-like enzyme